MSVLWEAAGWTYDDCMEKRELAIAYSIAHAASTRRRKWTHANIGETPKDIANWRNKTNNHPAIKVAKDLPAI